MSQKVLLKKSSIQGKTPTPAKIEYGELAINYASGTGKSFLATKKYDDTMAIFPEKEYNDATYATKGDINEISSNIGGINAKINAVSATVTNNYATKIVASGYAVSAKAEVIGTEGDQSSKDTIYGAKKYAEEQASAVKGELNGQIAAISSNVSKISASNNLISGAVKTLSGQVVSNYATKAYADSAATAAKNEAIDSAYTAAVTAANGYTDSKASELSSEISGVRGSVNALDTKVKTFSADVITKLSTVYKYKGTKASYDQLPGTGAEVGDVWNVVAAHGDTPAGTNYAWNGSEWDALGGDVDLSGYATTDDLSALSSKVGSLTNGLSASVVTNYVTKTMLATASGNAVSTAIASANAYTDKAISGFTSGNFLTVASATTRFGEITGLISGVDAKVGAVSATVKNTYATKEYSDSGDNVTKQALIGTTGDTMLADTIYGAKAYANDKVKDLSGNVVTEISVINSLTGSLKNGLSASVVSDYATKTFVANASGNAYTQAVTSAKAYTDSVISGFTSGNFLTVASASSIVSELTGKDNELRGIINAVSGTVNSIYATKAYADSAATVARKEVEGTSSSNSSTTTVQGAKKYTDEKVRQLSGAVKTELDEITSDTSALKNGLSASVVTNYVTKTMLATASGNAVSTAIASAKAYTDSVISGFTSGNFLTVASASTKFGEIEGRISENTAKINAVSATVNSNFATKVYADSAATTAKKEVIGTSSDSSTANTVYGAKKYADEAVKSFSGEVESKLGEIGSRISGVDTRVTNLSASVVTKLSSVYDYKGTKTNYSDLPTTGNKKGDVWNVVNANGNIPAGTNYAWDGSAWDALGGSVDLSGYATTGDVSEISSKVGTLSASVVSNYATKSIVASASANAITSANAYTDRAISGFTSGNFLTVASATSIVSELKGADSELSSKLGTLSSSVISNYATKSSVGSASANAITSAKAYTDSVISGFTSGNFLTVASASTRFSEITGLINDVDAKVGAVSATVNSNFATKAYADSAATVARKEVEGTSSSNSSTTTVQGSKKYTDEKVRQFSAAVKTDIDSIKSDTSELKNGLSASVVTNYVTKTMLATASGNAVSTAIASAKAYTDSVISGFTSGNFLTVASATSIVEELQGADNSIKNIIDAVSATVKSDYVTLGTNQTITGVKTFSNGYNLSKEQNPGSTYRPIPYADGEGSVTVKYVNDSVQSGLTYNPKTGIVRAAGFQITGKTDTDLLTANGGTVSSVSFADQSEFSGLKSNVSTLSGSVVNNYATNASVGSASANAITSAKAYTDSVITGFTSGNFLTVASATSIVDALTGADNRLSTKIDAVSATVSGTYATKAVASGYAVTAKNQVIGTSSDASTANTIYGAKKYADEAVKSFSGNVVTAIGSVQSDINGIRNNLSASVINDYATKVVASGYAVTALEKANQYTDSKISGFTSGNFLTVVSATSIVDQLTGADNALGQKIDAVSATVKDTFATKAYADSAATVAKTQVIGTSSDASTANTVYGAKKYTDEKVKALSGDVVTAIAGVRSDLSTLSSNTQSKIEEFSAGMMSKLSSVYVYKGSKTNYSELPTNAQTGDVWNVVNANGNIPAGTNYAWDGTKWDALGGSVDLSGYLTRSEFGTYSSRTESNISTLSGSVVSFSSSVITNYATKTVASGYAVSALTEAKAYTDQQISGIGLSNYLTVASATSIVDTLTSVDNQLIASAETLSGALATLEHEVEDVEIVVAEAFNQHNDRINAISGSISSIITTEETHYNELKSETTSLKNRVDAMSALSGTVIEIEGIIEEDEYITATALNALNERVSAATDEIADLWDALDDMPSGVEEELSEIRSKLSNLSGDVVTLISGQTAGLRELVEENEYIATAAINDLNNRLIILEDGIGNFDPSDYFTMESASTVITSMNSTINDIRTSYYTSAQTQSAITEAIAALSDGAFATSADMQTMRGELDDSEYVISNALNDLNSRILALEEENAELRATLEEILNSISGESQQNS